ncbi:hypothetical protein GMA12_06795 [Kocuria sediminis]|uniref:Esterase n=1 Tax=Kocuria sediminis TaxID=1038857 RepID=A0A6N8GJE1_9MICC|nr:hypothetical protein [Kocuria sediminis]MUN62849.1 hypothetical protein [Kocuria sediminis]
MRTLTPNSTSTTSRQARRRWRWFPRVAVSGALAGGLLLAAAPAQAVTTSSTGWHPVSGADRVFRADNGISLTYHYYAEGVDWDRPAGAVFFFDGDGTARAEQPSGSFATRMAQVAADTNRAFVFVEAPHGTRSWRAGSTGAVAEAVRQFATTNITPTTDAGVLLTGYSGGAEFLSRYLLRGGTDWLPAGSGAAFVGGGGTYGRPMAEATPATEDLALTWVVGDRDGAYATDSGSWSARAAAAQAEAAYRDAGYERARRITTAGAHTDYDIPAVVADRLTALDR